MFMARHRRSARGAGEGSGRDALWLNTQQRRYDFHLGEAIRAAIQGSHDKATKHSQTALSISRELYAGAPDPASHQPELAAALCTHARYGGGWQVIAMLAESAGHYTALAEADPAAYEVARIDVLTRVALASDEAGALRYRPITSRSRLMAARVLPASSDASATRVSTSILATS
jgi:hypothetical protein